MDKFLYFLLYFVCARLVIATDTSDSAERVFEFVNEARNKLKLSQNPNIILVVGNTGVGKSTLVHYVTGDYSKIVAIEPDGQSSEYKVYDGLDENIGNIESSTVSRTLIPEMNVDEEQNVWYDCPGFGDTRNETIEIATTFLIKSVIENAKGIKIVLLVNYESVTATHDRQDFDRGLSRLTELIQNIKQFEDSVSLVVTKTPSYYIRGKEIFEVFEDTVKNSTAQFANDHREVLKQKGSNEKKIQLIDAFLKQSSDGDYQRISVFWRPMEAGPFDKITKMVNGRQTIRQSITQQVSYANFEASDFGFPLTAEAKLKITEIAKHTIGEIALILKKIDNQLLSALQQKIQSTEDIHNKLELLELGQNGNEVASLQQWMDRFKSLIHAFDITSIDMEDFNRVERHESNLNILKSLAGTGITLPINDLMANSSETNKYQASERNWYSFFVQVIHFFSTYEVQRDVTAYDVASLSDWGQIDKTRGLIVNTDNFAEFTRLFPGVSISDINPAPSKLGELNNIISVTLRSPVQYECNAETMVIKGNFVRSADIQVSKCPQALKKINVFVVNTFFVDEDLSLLGMEELKVYTPIWKVQRAATFNLDGIEGASQGPLQNRGTAGTPGNVGMNAGNFFAFANELVNGELLTVTLNGGHGGTGQDGTDNDDVTVQFENMRHKDKSSGAWGHMKPSTEERVGHMLAQYDYEAVGVDIYRLHSRCCGATGLGGEGGLGGHPGIYSFICASSDTEHMPKQIANIGPTGGNGQTARVCKSTAVDIRKEIHRKKDSVGYKRTRIINLILQGHVDDPKCPDNLVKSEVPIPQQNPRTQIDVTSGITEYKTILLENMKGSAFKSTIQKAYDAIETNQELNRIYTVSAFANEANALEQIFYKLNEQVDMFPMYQNLFKRIEDYSTVNEANLSEVDRKVLRLLYTTIFGKAASIRSGHKSDLITDIVGFLEMTTNNIDKIDESGRISVINSHREKYINEISEKIKEAQSYIEHDIQSEIGNTFEKLNIEMEKTVNATIALQGETIKEIQKKAELAKKMGHTSFLKKAVGVMKKVVGVATTVISAATSVSGFISSAASLVSGQLDKPEMNIGGLLFSGLKVVHEEKIGAVENVLNKLKDSFNGNSKFEEIVNKLGGKLSDLLTIKTDPSSHNKLGGVLRDIMSFVDKPLQGINNVTEDMKKEILEPFKSATNALSVIATSISTYKQFSGESETKKLKSIGEAINADRERLRSLMAFEDRIYDELIPMLNRIQLNVNEVGKSSADKSLAALDMQKWKISQTFRAVQKHFDETLNGFETSDQVRQHLHFINEAINLMINIYDRIQNYHEQSRFVVYLSDIHSADYNNINVDDAQLRENINHLQFCLNANILLGLYERAVDAFKQAVYPFAAEYLDIYQLPQSLLGSKNDSIESVISTTVRNVQSLSQRIKELNSTVINENDMAIFNAHFDRNGDANGPFYVWSNGQIREKVKQLFAGQKIYLLADIAKSSHLNAIKFRSVGLGFHSENQTLNEILQSFHVSMTHMGESNYRCDNQFYTIFSHPLMLEFSFEPGRQTPAVRNIAYDKLSASNPSLSPYTLWAVQLLHGQFDRLTAFADTVDIELYGYGQYVKENANICTSNLEKYYSRHNV